MSSASLRPADLDAFKAVGISTPTILEFARVRRVTHDEARDLCGIRYKSAHLEGVAFPYIHPDNDTIVTWRVRRDHPEVGTDGRPIAKYVSPPDPRHLYLGPRCAQQLADTSALAIIVEAEKSVLAITEAVSRVNRPRALVLATGGCWGWRGVVGKVTGADGARVDQKGPLPDFDHVAWHGRDVVIVFDSNAATNTKVQAARRALAAELGTRGASVRIADLPSEDGINGPDDLIGKHGDAAFFRVMDEARDCDDGADEDRSRKESQSTRLVRLARDTGAEWFHDDEHAYLHIPVGEHHETYALRSRLGRAWLQGLLIDAAETCPSSQAIADAIHTLEAFALRGPNQRVHVRITASPGAIYVDLGDPTWRLVEITKEGWRLVVDVPVRFRRPKGLLPLPEPQTGGTITALRPFVNLSDDHFLMFVAWLHAALRGRGPYPVLVENGEQGSAKSTLAKMVKALIDPNVAPLRSGPRDPRDLMIAATNNHSLAFDNLSGISDWLSDALCRLATGGGFSTRTLYKDREEEIFDAVRPVVLNGIPDLATKPDLVSRSVFLELAPIPEDERRDEQAFWTAFHRERPRILGALYSAVSVALAREATVVLDRKPRMADFALWTVAAEPACPWKAGEFLHVYAGNRETAIDATLDGDPVADLARDLAVKHWKGTSTDFLARLNQKVPDAQRPKDWPNKPRQVGDALRRLAPALRQVGVDVQFGREGHKRTRTITIGNGSAARSAASADSGGGGDSCGRSADATVNTRETPSAGSSAPPADFLNVASAADAADPTDAPDHPSLSASEDQWTVR